jgi:hypothetical protein
MSQVKIYALRETLRGRKRDFSDAIHRCIMDVLGLPVGKRAHRFFPLEKEDFYMPDERSAGYTILEVMMMTGRTTDTRKALVGALYKSFESDLGIAPTDLEICIIESPPENWGFRGLHGDEAQLPYEVKR